MVALGLTVHQGPNVILVIHENGSFVSLSQVGEGYTCQRVGCHKDATMIVTAFHPERDGENVAARHCCGDHITQDWGPTLAEALQILERGPLQ